MPSSCLKSFAMQKTNAMGEERESILIWRGLERHQVGMVHSGLP